MTPATTCCSSRSRSVRSPRRTASIRCPIAPAWAGPPPHTLAAMRGREGRGRLGRGLYRVLLDPSGLGRPLHMSATLWDDSDVRAHRLMTDAVHEHGALAGVELWFGGARSRQPGHAAGVDGCGRLPNARRPPVPDARDGQGRTSATSAAGTAMRRCAPSAAGFDIVYVYATHGYLVANFLDPRDQHPHRRVRRVAGEPHAARPRADRGHEGGRRRPVRRGRALRRR